MQINLMVFIAQIFNFALLVFLLKKFLYQPILRMVEKRQETIQQNILNAENKAKESEAKLKEIVAEKNKFDQEKEKKFKKAIQEIENLKNQEKEELLLKVAQEKAKMRQELEKEKEELTVKISKLMAGAFLKMSDSLLKTLSDSATFDLVFKQFMANLKNLDKLTKAKIKESILKNNTPIRFIAHQELTLEMEKSCQELIYQFFNIPKNTEIEFWVDSDLILGLELNIGEYSIAWSLKESLATFNNNLKTLLQHDILNKGE